MTTSPLMRMTSRATRSARAQRARLVWLCLFAAAALSVPTKQAAAQVISTNPFHFYEHLGRDGAHVLHLPEGTLTATSTVGRITLWLASTSTTPLKAGNVYINNVWNQTSSFERAGPSMSAVTFTFPIPVTVGPSTDFMFWVDLSSDYWKIWSASSTASNFGDCASPTSSSGECPYAYVLYGPEVLPEIPKDTAPVVTCGLTDLGCATQKALVWAFYPSDETLGDFTMTLAKATSTWPFAYAFELPSLAQSLYPSATTSFSIGVPWHSGTGTTTIVLLSTAMLEAVPFVPTMRGILEAVIYFLTALTVYALVLRAHNQNTHTT